MFSPFFSSVFQQMSYLRAIISAYFKASQITLVCRLTVGVMCLRSQVLGSRSVCLAMSAGSYLDLRSVIYQQRVCGAGISFYHFQHLPGHVHLHLPLSASEKSELYLFPIKNAYLIIKAFIIFLFKQCHIYIYLFIYYPRLSIKNVSVNQAHIFICCPRLIKSFLRAVELLTQTHIQELKGYKRLLNCRFVESTANASATHLAAAACQVRAPTVAQRQQQQGQVLATPLALR